jgi:hypothetical protein
MIVEQRKPPVVTRKRQVNQRILVIGLIALALALVAVQFDGMMRELAANGTLKPQQSKPVENSPLLSNSR